GAVVLMLSPGTCRWLAWWSWCSFEGRLHHGAADRPGHGPAVGLAAGPATVLDDDRHGDLGVVRGREAGEPRVRRGVRGVLGRTGLAGDADTGHCGLGARAVRDDELHHLGELVGRRGVDGLG